MYAVEVLTPAAAPITAAELRARLRLNDDAEDDALTEFLATAVEQFEASTRRPVLTTVYRQYLSRWPAGGAIVLGRGGITAVAGVQRYRADGSTVDALADWIADLRTPPARVTLAEVPDEVETGAGLVVRPVGYVQFSAGWANAAAVPKAVRTALMLLAGHYYENREAFKDSAFEMRELPEGWARVVNNYRLGLDGDWGQ